MDLITYGLLNKAKANLDSPAFTGTPTAPTPATTDNSVKLATTEFVRSFVATLKGFYLGVTTTTLVDEVTTDPNIVINGETVTAQDGNWVIASGGEEFVYSGTVWQKFGDSNWISVIGNTYNPALTYNMHDCVIYMDGLYECQEDDVTGDWDSSKWQATTIIDLITGGIPLENLSNVTITNPQAGNHLVFDGTEWKNSTIVSPALSELSDVELENITDGQALVYNDEIDKWENKDISTGEVTKTVTGNPIEFTDGADAPFVKCTTTIQGYQEGTGTPSPDNVRPIHAYTENTISVGADLLKTSPASGITVVKSDGKAGYSTNNQRITSAVGYTGTGTNVTTGTLFQPGTYTISIEGLDDCTIIITNKNHSAEVIQNLASSWNPLPFTFTIESEGLLICSARKSDNSVLNPSDYKIYIEQGNQVKHTTHTTTFPSAIYRGMEDVVNGTETHDMEVVDLSTLTCSKSGNNFNLSIPGIKRPSSTTVALHALCSAYEIIPQQYPRANTISGVNWMDGITFWGDGSYETIEDFKAAMSGVMLAYELATPTTTPVTPTNLPIKSLFGYNHIESSTGDMEVEYITNEYQPLVDLIESTVELPEVSNLDDGKVLTVVNGKWVAASLPVGQNTQY